MTNIEKRRWGSCNENSNNERTDDELYDVIQPTSTTPIKSPSLPQLRRTHNDGHSNHNVILRDSLVGFKDGVPGIFSGYAAEKVRSSIKKKQPFYGHDENYTVLNLSDAQNNIGDEATSDDELPSVDLSTINFNARKSIANKHVIVETGIGNSHVETGMRFYNPMTETTYRHTSSFLVNLSGDGNESSSSYGSEVEQYIEQSDVVPLIDDAEIYEAIGSPRTSLTEKVEPDYANIDYGKVKKNIEKLPRLPPRNSIVYYSADDKETYFEVEMKEEMKPVKLPPLKHPSAEYQIKRYQLIKCIMEKEYAYMTSLRRLVKEYEEPLLKDEIIAKEGVKSMFKDVHEIMQCHQLFSMALNYRANEWDTKEVIGDVILASFSKSMVFKAYCNFVCRFSNTMGSIKETCKSVPAFLNFLKSKEYDREAKQSLYHLMCKPLEYIPNIVLLTETLLNETPFPHEDRLPLQMALTHLECLCENLTNERTDIIMKEKVKYLDSQCIGLEKELTSKARYFIRHDDMLLCETENGKLVKTKPCKIFMLNDVILCVSNLSKRQQVQLMTNKVYKVKWCFPISDVHIVDVTSGIYISTEAKKGLRESSYQIFSGRYPSEYVEDLLHDLTMVGDIMGKVSSLRLSYSFVDSNKVNEWYKEVHKRLDSVMEMANMNWIELSIPSGNQGEREQLLFNVPSPKTKLEWSMDFENINLLLTGDNNPGWYMQEENIYEHEVVSLRRALPLVAAIQPLFMVNPETSVQCVLDTTAASPSKRILWIFSGNEQLGVITLLEMIMPSIPHVLHSYVACNERICCAEMVMKKDESHSEESPFVWIGTMSGRVMIYNALDINERQPMMSTTLDDSIVSMKFTNSGVFIGLANGSLLCFKIEAGATWNISNPTIVSLSLFPIVSITESCEKLWCASGSVIYIIEKDTMLTEEQITTSDDRKGTIKQLISYGIGVWVSTRKSTILLLYHGETKQQLQMINTATAITRMKSEIEGSIRSICTENIYVTTLLAKEGLLWVGMDQGLIVTYPLPELGGLPTVSGKACVSFHAHSDCVKHIHAFSLRKSFQSEVVGSEENEEKRNADDIGIVCNSTEPTDASEAGTKKNCTKNYADPEYFTLEPEEEPVTETSSISETDEEDEKNGRKDGSNENEEQTSDQEGIRKSVHDRKEPTVNNKFECNNPPYSKSSGKVVESNKNEYCPSTKRDIKNININKDEYDSDDNISPNEDFSFIEDEMSDSKKKDSSSLQAQALSLKLGRDLSDDNLRTKLPFLGNDGFANMMEDFDGFNEMLSKPICHTHVNKDAIDPNELSDVASSSGNVREDRIQVDDPVTLSAVPLKVGVPVTICDVSDITEKQNIQSHNHEIIMTEEDSERKDTVGGQGKSDVPAKVEIPLTFATPRRNRKQNSVKGTEIPARVDDPKSRTIESDARKILTEEVTENSNMVERPGKFDGPTKVEIPLTFPTPRRNRKQNGNKDVNIPDCADDTILNPIYESSKNLNNSQVESKGLPATFFVQGESFSAYDLRKESENVASLDDKCPYTTDTVSENSSEDHIYEVPLNICDDFYATLEEDQDLIPNEDINSKKPVRSGRSQSGREYRTKSLPLPDNPSNVETQKSIKRTSKARSSHNNSAYFPPLCQKRKGSSKASNLAFTEKESRNDLEKKSWYVVSIGRGHVDLRKGSEYKENLNLLNSSSFEGREPMLMLWKLNAGNSIFFME